MKKRADGRYCKKVKLPDGTQKYFYSTAKTEREAVKDFNRQLMEYEQSKQKGESFAKVAEKWNAEYRERISDINYRTNSKAPYNRILEYFKQYQICDITAVEVNQFINFLILKNYAKKTIKNHKSILNMIFSFAILNGYIKYNPVSDVRLPNNLPQSIREMPTTEQIREIDKHYTDFDLFPYFMMYTGLRRSEALAIDYSDIDFKNKTIKVYKRLLFDGNRPVIEEATKTQSSQRTVILLDRLSKKLPHRKKGLLFCNTDGTPYSKKQFVTLWDNYKKRYNLNITTHQLRHAFATMLFEANIDVKDAQELMGHSDINLTRQIYTHIRNERKTETLNKLNKFQF